MTVGDATSAPLHDSFYAERAVARARSQLTPGSVGLRSGTPRTYNDAYMRA